MSQPPGIRVAMSVILLVIAQGKKVTNLETNFLGPILPIMPALIRGAAVWCDISGVVDKRLQGRLAN
jgi:hypothetical protein